MAKPSREIEKCGEEEAGSTISPQTSRRGMGDNVQGKVPLKMVDKETIQMQTNERCDSRGTTSNQRGGTRAEELRDLILLMPTKKDIEQLKSRL